MSQSESPQLAEVFEQLSQDKNLARKFTESPEQTLQSLGVPPGEFQVQETPLVGAFVPPQPTTAAKSVQVGVADVAVCGSVGCVVCASVG